MLEVPHLGKNKHSSSSGHTVTCEFKGKTEERMFVAMVIRKDRMLCLTQGLLYARHWPVIHLLT